MPLNAERDFALDTDAILLDVWGLDGETMFVGGTSGTILRHEDGTWRHAEVPVSTEIFAAKAAEQLRESALQGRQMMAAQRKTPKNLSLR